MPKFNPCLQKYKPKDFILVFDAKVLKILELNKSYPGQIKLKTVFMAESVTGIPRMCVYWGNKINLEVGDFVSMEGRLKNNVFIASSLYFKKRTPPEKEEFSIPSPLEGEGRERGK